MQECFSPLIKKALAFVKRLGRVAPEGHETSPADLIIPGDNYHVLKKRYYSYRNLLLKNNELLKTLSDIEEGIESGTLDTGMFRAHLSRLFDTAFGFIQSLNDMADNRYIHLYGVLDRIRSDIQTRFEEVPDRAPGPLLVIPLDKITARNRDETGGKAANLGEIRNLLRLPSPAGFSITVRAYKEFLTLNGLEEATERLLDGLDINDLPGIDRASREIMGLFVNADVPPGLKEAVERETRRLGLDKTYSVRSSAVGEDGRLSFAGQFRSILNVKAADIVNAFKEVAAGKYQARAIFYRMAKGLRDRDVPMSVLVLEMVDSRSSGVLYTLNPNHPDKDEMLISTVWGQGQYAVGGTVPPDMYLIDRNDTGRVTEKTINRKMAKLTLSPDGGLQEHAVPETDQDRPSISDDEVRMLYHYGLLIEKHFGKPQDIEWAIDDDCRLEILQARPLNVRRSSLPSYEIVHLDTNVVAAEGETASRGVASGPVYIVDRADQLLNFPEGAVLVARNSSNDYVRIMRAVSAIIVGTGSRMSHLATLAREFNVPMIINAGDTGVFHNKEMVTVDAYRGRIYKGRIESLLRTGKEPASSTGHSEDEKTIRNVMKLITPLNLTKIDEAEISLDDFRTIHDIIRYVHEVSVKEMFHIGELTEGETSTQLLTSEKIPMYFYVIDLDGGVADEAKFLRRITPGHISSIPFRAILRGMTYEGVRWAGPVDIDMKSLASVMTRAFVRTGVAEKGGKVYVIVTDQYVNMSVKLAFHFTVFDAFCGESYINNYINFRFQGGGAGSEGRYRRALFIKDILDQYDFKVQIQGDMVIAELKGASKSDTEHRLDILGRLLGCSRQLDMAISSMEAKEWYVREFMKGNYSFVHE
ncbi:MAG: PEP/pyruvate-binding domain-containing protein [Nitrospirota bacterium]